MTSLPLLAFEEEQQRLVLDVLAAQLTQPVRHVSFAQLLLHEALHALGTHLRRGEAVA